MKFSIIFYGYLLENQVRDNVTKMFPSHVFEGHILGEVKITHELSSEGTHHYPILSIASPTTRIFSECVLYEGSSASIKQLILRLKEYEGPFYRSITAKFYSRDGIVRTGLVFVTSKLPLPETVQIERVVHCSRYFNWRQYAALFL